MQAIPLSTLTVQPRLRQSSRHQDVRVTKREFADFLIDGKSLLDMAGGDYMSCFVRGFRKQNAAACKTFMDANATKLFSLYICPECGDIGCGAVVTRIARRDDDVIWERLAWDNGMADAIHDDMREAFADKNLGPFRFEAAAYEATILAASRI